MSETYKCSEVIKTCAYAQMIKNGTIFCDYLCRTGKRRGCNPEQCTKYEPKTDKKNVYRIKL